MNRNRYTLSALCVVCLLLASCGGAGRRAGEDSRVAGPNIVETGTLEAVRTNAFVMARALAQYASGNIRIVGLIEHGSMVQAGDSLMQFDLSGINRYIMDRETSLENERATREKLIVTNDNRIQGLESSVQNELASFNLKKIEVESTAFESERTKKIKELEFEQAKINLAMNQRRLELARIMNENDIRNAERNKGNYTLRTTVNGVFQVGLNYRAGGMLKVGDEPLYNQPLGNVPELEHMKVTTYINENDFLKIHTGQKVAVRLDATPDIVFDGEIAYIGKLCHLKEYGTGSRQKVFDVEVKLLRPDERLKPGMTVSCEFIMGS